MFSLFVQFVNSVVSIDCPLVINLATSLQMSASLTSSLRSNCCLVTTLVTCEGGRVTKLLWGHSSLSGTINGSWIPPLLEVMYFYNNMITGSLPILPATLKELYINENSMTGEITMIPPLLTGLGIDHNYFTGELPKLPDSVLLVFVDNNRFSGTFAATWPTTLHIHNNYFTNVILASTTQIEETECNISNTPLKGHAIVFVLAGKNCIVSGLYFASLLPFTLSKSLKSTSSAKILTNYSTFIPTLTMYKSSGTMPSTSFSLSKAAISAGTFPSANSENLDNGWLHTSAASNSYFSEYVSTNTSIQSSIETLSTENINKSNLEGDPNSLIVYLLIAGIVVLCAILVVSSRFVKNPKINSKFGRKNSFGTLNTVQTTMK